MINFLLIPLGAFLYRWRGMSHPSRKWAPRPIPQGLFSLPYAIITYIFYLEYTTWDNALLPALIVLALTTAGACTGHGRGMDLGDTDNGEPERLEFLITWLKPHVSLYWYDAALLAVTGLAITLPAGIATLNPVLALSGLLKAPAYMIGKFGCPRDHVEAGELLTGAVLWGALCLI